MTPNEQRETAAEPERPVELRATSARQGVGGQDLRYVLGIGLALVVIAFAIIYFTHF